MRTVQDVYSIINTFSPFSTQEKWDNSGLLVGTGSMPVHKIYVTSPTKPLQLLRNRVQI